MTQIEFERAMYDLQLESQRLCNEKVKAEIILVQLDVQLKQAQLNGDK
jgi:hypothetical protein